MDVDVDNSGVDVMILPPGPLLAISQSTTAIRPQDMCLQAAISVFQLSSVSRSDARSSVRLRATARGFNLS